MNRFETIDEALATYRYSPNLSRASYTEWRSIAHPDPGAVTVLMIIPEIHRVVEQVTLRRLTPTFWEILRTCCPTITKNESPGRIYPNGVREFLKVYVR